jgi:polar amino acid transport system substrate-binding protein
MHNLKTIIATILILVIGIAFGARIFSTNPTSSIKPDLLSSILAKGEIKVGYVVYPPGLIKDPNTGKLSGIFHDTLELAAKNLGLKVNWSEEVGWGTMIEGLNAGRYDMIGSPVWPNSTRAKSADFTIPISYSGVGVYTRTGESRFTDLSKINNQNVTIATADGEMSSFIAKENFPNAKTVSLPQDTAVSELLLNLKTGKADITFVETAIAEEFLASNPGSIQNITPNNPIRSFANTMILPKNQESFKSTINSALQELINNGNIDNLISKYQKYPNSFYKVSKPFEVNR